MWQAAKLQPAILLKMAFTSHAIFNIFMKLFETFFFYQNTPQYLLLIIYVTIVMFVFFHIKISCSKDVFRKIYKYTVAIA